MATTPQEIRTADGRTARTGDRVFDFYDGHWGTVGRIDSEGWFNHVHEDGSRSGYLNGERVAFVLPRTSPLYDLWEAGRTPAEPEPGTTFDDGEITFAYSVTGQLCYLVYTGTGSLSFSTLQDARDYLARSREPFSTCATCGTQWFVSGGPVCPVCPAPEPEFHTCGPITWRVSRDRTALTFYGAPNYSGPCSYALDETGAPHGTGWLWVLSLEYPSLSDDEIVRAVDEIARTTAPPA